MVKRSSSQFSQYSIQPGRVCWQINSDDLEPPLHDGNWEDELAKALVDLAEAHEGSELLCSTNAGESTDFGSFGFSVWIACAGSPPMVKACGDLIQELIPRHQLRRSQTQHGQHWVERIRMADGKVWRSEDAASWTELDVGPQTIDELYDLLDDEDDCDDLGLEDDEPAIAVEEAVESKVPRKRRTYTARGDVKVAYYQRKVEKMLGLPDGSVKFVNPDRSISRADQLVRSLRARWEE